MSRGVTTHTGTSTDDLFSIIGGVIGIGSGKIDISKDNLKTFLNEVYQKYQKGLDNGVYTGFAMTFAFLNPLFW